MRWRFARFSVAQPASDDLEKLFNRCEVMQCLHGPIEIEGDILVNQHIAKPRQPFEFAYELGGKSFVAHKSPDTIGVVFETLAAATHDITGDVNDKLTDDHQGEQHVVVQRQIDLQRATIRHTLAQRGQMIQMTPQLDEALSKIWAHRWIAASLRARVRARNGLRSAARS